MPIVFFESSLIDRDIQKYYREEPRRSSKADQVKWEAPEHPQSPSLLLFWSVVNYDLRSVGKDLRLCQAQGYRFDHEGAYPLITVFSAPNYATRHETSKHRRAPKRFMMHAATCTFHSKARYANAQRGFVQGGQGRQHGFSGSVESWQKPAFIVCSYCRASI